MNERYQVPDYRAMARKYGLSPLVAGNDITLNEAGDDIAVSSDGRWKLGPDDRTNALHYLVEGWRNNVPILHQLFDLASEAFSETKNLLRRSNEVAAAVVRGELPNDEFHGLNDTITSVRLSRDACAGAVMVVLNNLLQLFWHDLGNTKGPESRSVLIAGYSLRQIVRAASANFRHYDEWAKTNPPDRDKQLASIKVIAAVLDVRLPDDGSGHPFGQNICGPVLAACSDGSFETLEDRLFSYARNKSRLA